MQRRLLQIVPSTDALLALTSDELARALLEDMQARLSDPIAGMANREHLETTERTDFECVRAAVAESGNAASAAARKAL